MINKMIAISLFAIGIFTIALIVLSILTYNESKKKCGDDKNMKNYTTSILVVSGLLLVGIVIILIQRKGRGGAGFAF